MTINFLFRNVFRFKKNLIMMIIGVGGCSAILLTGFGIQDSLSVLQNNQFTITEPVLALDNNNTIYCEVALTFVYETVIQNETTQVEANTTTALQINLNNLMTGELNLNLPNIMQGSLTMNIEFGTFAGAPESEDTEDTTN